MALGVGPSAGNAIASQSRSKTPAKPSSPSIGGFLSNVVNTGIDIMSSPSRRKDFIEGMGKRFDASPLGSNINSVVNLVQDPGGVISKAFGVGNTPPSPRSSLSSARLAQSPLNPQNRGLSLPSSNFQSRSSTTIPSFFSKGPSISPPSIGGFKGPKTPTKPTTSMKVTPR